MLARGSRSTATAARTAEDSRSGCCDRECQGGRRSHRHARDVEAVERKLVGEREQVVHEHRVAPAVGHVPARPGMAARVRQVAAVVLAQQRALGRPVLERRGGRGMEEHEWRSLALDRVVDVEAAGADLRHRPPRP